MQTPFQLIEAFSRAVVCYHNAFARFPSLSLARYSVIQLSELSLARYSVIQLSELSVARYSVIQLSELSLARYSVTAE